MERGGGGGGGGVGVGVGVGSVGVVWGGWGGKDQWGVVGWWGKGHGFRMLLEARQYRLKLGDSHPLQATLPRVQHSYFSNQLFFPSELRTKVPNYRISAFDLS